VQQRPDDRDEHPELTEKEPSTGRLRTGETAEAQDEEDRREQITEGEKNCRRGHEPAPACDAADFTGDVEGFFWNIRSIRSVMRNPPTTLIVAHVTATKPSSSLSK
jgi:hypothetical protein